MWLGVSTRVPSQSTDIANHRPNNIHATPVPAWILKYFLKKQQSYISLQHLPSRKFNPRGLWVQWPKGAFIFLVLVSIPTHTWYVFFLFYDLCLRGICIGKVDKAINFLTGHILNDITLKSQPVFSLWLSAFLKTIQ